MRLYLDINVYNRPFDDQSIPRNRDEARAILRLLEKIRVGEIDLVSSFVVETEYAISPFGAKGSVSSSVWRKSACGRVRTSREERRVWKRPG